MILRKVENYLRDSGMSATAFGQRVARDPRLVHDLRRGREAGPSMIRRIDQFIGAGR
jgi:hypothetical protein